MIFAPFSIPNPSKMPIIGHDFCSIFEPWHHRIAVPPHRRTAPHHRIAPPHHTTPPQCTTPSHHRSDRSPTYRWNFRIESAPYFRVEFDVFYHFFGRFCATFFVPFFFTFFVSFLIFFLTLFWYSFCPFFWLLLLWLFGPLFLSFFGHFFWPFFWQNLHVFCERFLLSKYYYYRGFSEPSRGEPEHCTTASHHRIAPPAPHHHTTAPHRFLLHFRTQIHRKSLPCVMIFLHFGARIHQKSLLLVMIFAPFSNPNPFDGFGLQNEAKIMTKGNDFWWI